MVSESKGISTDHSISCPLSLFIVDYEYTTRKASLSREKLQGVEKQ